MKNKQRKGQGIVESVFAVGILMMVLTGAVLLITFGVNNRKIGFDRRKATELASLVTEKLVSESKNNPEEFWKLTDQTSPQSEAGFDGYSYTIDFTNYSVNPCGVGKIDCANVVISIGWSGKEIQKLDFNRFFSR
jgi:hypothetical protein